MASDWYPHRLSERPEWHANFATQAAATGTDFGLTAPQVTQIASDAVNVALFSNYIDEVAAYAQAVTAWKDETFQATIGTPMADGPTIPAGITLVGTASAIEARTRQYANLIKSSMAYSALVGEAYRIVSPVPSAPSVPALTALALTQSQVQLSIMKAGYSLLVIDSRRGAGGVWEQIGVAQTASYTDDRDPMVAGQPEVREYRVQGMQNNARVGAASAVVSAVTVP